MQQYLRSTHFWPTFISSDISSAIKFYEIAHFENPTEGAKEEEKLPNQSSAWLNSLFFYLSLLKSQPLKFLC